ncbi:hypothetical protein NKJ59_30845 [Mesorhizobium australicum]|uniref:CocE/NonD family hydrolase C-terminal non-catalytic domain-containing protein n=1 Tax=Mesorhizobium australicum TaxID=536018 RepID=UPI00333AD534
MISLCSTDDRYNDDSHYVGGAQICDNLDWGTTAWAICHDAARPAHRRRPLGASFRKAASTATGGWADSYPNPIFRMVENLPGTRKGLIGPWGTNIRISPCPDRASVFSRNACAGGISISRGIDTGITCEPMLRAWIQDPYPPAAIYDERPGRWVAERSWPAGVGERSLAPSPSLLAEGARTDDVLRICSPSTLGLSLGAWCGNGVDPTLPIDQRMEAGNALVFETKPLEEAVEILGFPEFEVTLASDKPAALISATLSLVLEDGAASRVSYGILNDNASA